MTLLDELRVISRQNDKPAEKVAAEARVKVKEYIEARMQVGATKEEILNTIIEVRRAEENYELFSLNRISDFLYLCYSQLEMKTHPILSQRKINLPSVESYGREKYEIVVFITPDLVAKYIYRGASNWDPMLDFRNAEESDRYISQVQIFNIQSSDEVKITHCYKLGKFFSLSATQLAGISANMDIIYIWNAENIKLQHEFKLKNSEIKLVNLLQEKLYIVSRSKDRAFLNIFNLQDNSKTESVLPIDISVDDGQFVFNNKLMNINENGILQSINLSEESFSPRIKEHGCLEGVFCYGGSDNLQIVVSSDHALFAIHDHANKTISIWKLDEAENLIAIKKIEDIVKMADEFLIDGSLVYLTKNSVEIFDSASNTCATLLIENAYNTIKSINLTRDYEVAILRQDKNASDILEIHVPTRLAYFWSNWLDKQFPATSIPTDIVGNIISRYYTFPGAMFRAPDFKLQTPQEEKENDVVMKFTQ